MPYKCSIKGCRSNYDSMLEKVSLFQFPVDLTMKAKWLSKIQLNSKLTSFSRVCAKHFSSQDIDDTTRRRLLKPYAVPKAAFIEHQSSKVKEELDKPHKKMSTEAADAADQIQSFTQFCEEVQEMQIEDWHIYMTTDGICFYRLNSDNDFNEVEMVFKVLVNKHMRVKLCNKGRESSTEELSWVLRECHLQSWSQFVEILVYYQQEPEIVSKNQPKKYLKKAYEALTEVEEVGEMKEHVDSLKAQLISLCDFANTLQDIEQDFYTQPLVESLVANETTEDLDIVEEFLVDDEEEESEFCGEFKEEDKEMEMKIEEEEEDKQTAVMNAVDEESLIIEYEDPLRCPKCFITLLSDSGLRAHEKTCKIHFPKIPKSRIQDDDNVCDICGKLFSTMRRLKEHMKLHNQGLRKKCPHCDIVIFAGILQRHIRTVHEKSKPHACSICNKAFSTPSLRNDHEKTHSKNVELQQYLTDVNGSPRYSCPKCSADYETSTLLRKHIEKNCRVAQKKRVYRYPCPDCSKKFSTKLQAAQHRLATHKVEIKNIDKYCFECNDEFDDYVNHIRLHSCNFACRFCGSKFLTQDRLKNHEETKHATETEDDRPFKCDEKECRLSFKNINHLRSHRQAIHVQQEREFQCNQCDKKFGLKAHLTVHVRQHNASFPCNFKNCSRLFKKLNNLKEHFEREHGIAEIYLCNFEGCGERFKMLAQLKTHRECSHGVAFNISKYFEKSC